ncbi:hypothetical protein PS623_04178 [Pseudomonas fluorescens]|nr:hypothetical protein PS623_04178 [Pseudomonas fluorescens]
MQGLAAALGAGMDKAPEGQDRAAIHQIHEVFVGKRHHTGQQLAEHRIVALHGITGTGQRRTVGIQAEHAVAQVIDAQLQYFELGSGRRSFFFGSAAPRDHIARALAVPVKGAAQGVRLRDGQVLDQVRMLRVLAADRLAQLQSGTIDRLASLSQSGKVFTLTTA